MTTIFWVISDGTMGCIDNIGTVTSDILFEPFLILESSHMRKCIFGEVLCTIYVHISCLHDETGCGFYK